MGAVLLVSGIFHLALSIAMGAVWSGPLSLRKPGLFGVSAGMTVWSIAWVMTKLYPRRWDRWFANAMACGLLLEVALITVQYWRGVASHFNRTTTLNAIVESVMLGLILLVTLGIVWLSLRSVRLPPMEPADALALRGGLWLLTFSCALGILITVVGDLNMRFGKPPELWRTAGILKYPHGAALHAIQALPLLSWFVHKLRVTNPRWYVQTAMWSQVLFLVHALWQTMHGRARFDFDGVGGFLFVSAGLMLVALVASLSWRVVTLFYPLKSPRETQHTTR